MNLREAVNTFRGHRIPHLDVIGRRRWWLLLSGSLIALSVIGLFARNLNYSIDFEGGALLEYPNNSGVSVQDVQGTLADFGRGDAQVQIVNGTDISIRTETLNELPDAERAELLEALARQADIDGADISRQDIGPTWGSEISRKALRGLLIFLVVVTLFIAVRFEWKMALGAQAALLHDLIITAGIYALVGREVTPATVIAILTILGYSLYDTVVIFDKVKENAESAALLARNSYSDVVNLSLNQTLMRSLNTSLVVLLPILALLLFGGDTLKDFAFALFVGVACGAYSSIFVASPILAVLKEREPRFQQLRARLEARPSGLRSVPAGAALAADGNDGEAPSRAASSAAATRTTARSRTVARPRSRGKRKAPAKRKRR